MVDGAQLGRETLSPGEQQQFEEDGQQRTVGLPARGVIQQREAQLRNMFGDLVVEPVSALGSRSRRYAESVMPRSAAACSYRRRAASDSRNVIGRSSRERMKPRLLHHDVAHGLSESLLERVPPDSAFEGRIGFALAMLDKLLVAVLGWRHLGRCFKPSTSSVPGVARRGRKFKGRVLTAERDCVRLGYRPHMGAFLGLTCRLDFDRY